MNIKRLSVKYQTLQTGYSLVELAMVLIVIGIVMLGVVKGVEWIDNAKLKSVINDFENITQAHYTYIQRTGEPPGLPRNATGIVTGSEWESNQYFADLIAEELIVSSAGGGANILHAFQGVWSVELASSLFEGAQLCAEGIPMFAARGIDNKLDDGVPNTGRLITLLGSSSTVLTEYTTADTLTMVCKQL